MAPHPHHLPFGRAHCYRAAERARQGQVVCRATVRSREVTKQAEHSSQAATGKPPSTAAVSDVLVTCKLDRPGLPHRASRRCSTSYCSG